MSFLNKRNLLSFLIVILIFLAFGGGFFYGQQQCKVCPPQEIDFSLFWEAYNELESKYVETGKLNQKTVVYRAISGLTESLDDPYTVFMEPENTKRFMEDVQGQFEGVGMEIGVRDRQLQVISPLPETPAEKAGLKGGDKILKVDGESTSEMTIDEAVNKIRGSKGSVVTLTVARESWQKSKDIDITRGVIDIPSLEWYLVDQNGEKTKEGEVAYLRLYHFSEKARKDFREAALSILNSPAKKIVLDLRGNPGGYLEVYQYIAGWFLEDGKTVTIEHFGEEREDDTYKAKGNSMLKDYPIIVLLNQGSASASEILAGALRDQREIKIVGKKSFGKGSVQELVKLSDKSSLKITVAKWLTPNGSLIQDKGIEPDVEVDIPDEIEEGEDPQLDKAIEILTKQESN